MANKYAILTENELKILRFLAASAGKEYSINEMSRLMELETASAYIVLMKFAFLKIIKEKKIGNMKAYHLNFDFEDKTILERTNAAILFALIPSVELNTRILLRANAFKKFQKIALCAIMFGSYILNKKKPHDIDVLFILEKEKYDLYRETLKKVQEITPIKIHDVVQTKEDVRNNLKQEDAIIKEAISRGIVLWGFNELIEVIRDANR